VCLKVKYQLGWQELEQENPDVVDIDVTKASLCHPLCQCIHCGLYQQVDDTTTTAITTTATTATATAATTTTTVNQSINQSIYVAQRHRVSIVL